MKLWQTLLLLAVMTVTPPALQAAGKSQARLVLQANEARPGDTILAGMHLKMPPKWHTYWLNPGDSGMATKIDWTLPPGITAGDIQWPVPEKFTAAGLVTYGYHDEVMLLVPLTIAGDAASGAQEIKAKVSWLECEELCLPGNANVRASLTIGASLTPSENAAAIDAWKAKMPASGAGETVIAWWEKAPLGDARPLIIQWKTADSPASADFFPYASADFEVQAPTERLPTEGGFLRLRKQVKLLSGEWPSRVSGVLVYGQSQEHPDKGFEVQAPIAAASPLAAADSEAEAGGQSIAFMLLLGFVGGLILNVMPCVLPVIALKVLSFVKQTDEPPARVRQLGLIFGAGVLVSFLILAGMVIGVQQAGQAASWGMQFQNPKFLLFITVLVLLVALNLFGVFEVTLGGSAMGAAGELAGREGAAGAFFHGLLVTALATPCTAPFLGVALGFAFAQPPLVILLMFVAIAAGLAAPYVVLSLKPAWVKFMPKPGAWMEKFKTAMGFPMLATAIWLFSILLKHFGEGAAWWLGLFMVLTALAAWVFGEFVQRGRRHKAIAAAVCVILLGGGYGYALEGGLNWRAPVGEKIAWKSWSAEAVVEARATGRPVVVDFTADWCITCQVNKKTSIEIPSVRKKIKETNAVTFIGDYTLKDEAITRELQRFGRAGVPLVVVYPSDPNAEPIVLPEVLTPGIVLDALDRAARKR